MIDIVKGRFWDLPWSLVDGCTPCSPGCDHCWAAGMAHRFARCQGIRNGEPILTNTNGQFKGVVIPRLDHLAIPLKRRKPTVYAIWTDLFCEAVPTEFIDNALDVMAACPHHTFLVLTKRAHLMNEKIYGVTLDHGCRELGGGDYLPNVWWGLTVCNQAEADEKIPIFLLVTGNKFLSIEPMLGPVDLGISLFSFHIPDHFDRDLRKFPAHDAPGIDAVILGGETGPGARPLHPDWVRSVRGQCFSAGVPFFFKSWGKHIPDLHDVFGDRRNVPAIVAFDRSLHHRFLDGRTHDALPWVTP